MLNTDASLSGWGAVLDRVVPARGFHAPRLRRAQINVLELATVRLALESLVGFLKSRESWVLVKSDTAVTVGAVNAMASRSVPLMNELRELHLLCATRGLTIRAEHMPSAVNVFADRLSREGDSTDWTLPAPAFAALEEQYGPHTIDLFASHLNKKCGRFYGRTWSPGCTGTNALAQDWSGKNG